MKLIIVGLPIGNIEDISLRSIRTLTHAKTVICEDTRIFNKLWQKLQNLGYLQASFAGRLMVINDFNEAEKINYVLEQIGPDGEAIFVSDAGMPTISDPGYRLINEVLSRGGMIEVVPGPTAAMTALATSGLSSDRVLFLGFLPKKPVKRKQNWELIKRVDGLTVIIYESPTRVIRTLKEIEAEFGSDTQTVVARELTKEYEEVKRGKISDLTNQIKSVKGEVVILFRV